MSSESLECGEQGTHPWHLQACALAADVRPRVTPSGERKERQGGAADRVSTCWDDTGSVGTVPAKTDAARAVKVQAEQLFDCRSFVQQFPCYVVLVMMKENQVLEHRGCVPINTALSVCSRLVSLPLTRHSICQWTKPLYILFVLLCPQQ